MGSICPKDKEVIQVQTGCSIRSQVDTNVLSSAVGDINKV